MNDNRIDRIFNLLSEDAFKDPNTGLLFFPAYIYTYDPREEYQIRKEINLLNEQLKRPSNSLNCMVINIYVEFLTFLKEQTYNGETLLDDSFNYESEDFEGAQEYLKVKAQEEGEFLDYLGQKIEGYFKDRDADKVYFIVYGFGSIFPYLRVSHFLKNTEKYIKHHKLIVFYPGTYSNANYSLFGEFNDDNLYRANHLNQLL
ncbi:hypothetical protein CHU00_15790 [Sphingobacterium cellulitidis]|uniref:BREX protein BrxB domain-containing protein n=1 Tax=Sphingobacterium cellulitidis TaxID=1768011 RepID=UPI000B93D682|nr:BREX protein BrxB domain-containing protein [Sphingobacterium cellulitidis]OYD42846.1 hypothetical protein CHT99_08525 [Sphingobacterium cellulitidis]OYD44654.1 hypothetical protein CHU00_15790 [Sphingobacterium cellulitidis]